MLNEWEENKMEEKYNVTYSCGCVHEIEHKKTGFHEPTGNNKDCEIHKQK